MHAHPDFNACLAWGFVSGKFVAPLARELHLTCLIGHLFNSNRKNLVLTSQENRTHAIKKPLGMDRTFSTILVIEYRIYK